jgi:predicted RNase H-like nuclease (RuvC/YqgF family)
MGKGGKRLQNINQEIKELQDSLHDLDNLVLNLHKQIDWKDKLIEALQLKLIEKEQQIENMVDATCDTNDLIQMVDVTCDTNDLMQMMDVTCDIDDLMQMLDATCDTNDLMEMVDKNAIKEMVDDSLPIMRWNYSSTVN